LLTNIHMGEGSLHFLKSAPQKKKSCLVDVVYLVKASPYEGGLVVREEEEKNKHASGK